ncbi:MAG: sigma-E factor negative regulatory protein [Alphaproteobacteria bacterium]|nr:sigma-E factor negative regulatory protein [Alphaproteobacteria bacterium]
MTAPSPGDPRLSALLDDALDRDEAEAVQAALRSDPALADELARVRRARDALRRHGHLAAPEGFADAVLDRLDEVEAPPAPGWRWQGWALAAAAALVLWVALPTAPEAPAPEVSAASDGAVGAASLEGAPAVVLVASRWRLATPDGVDVVRATVEASGGSLGVDGELLELRAPADRILEVRSALARLGALEDVGERRPAGGKVRVTVELLR